jgi:hypothetical protein
VTSVLRWLLPGVLFQAGLALPPARARWLVVAAIALGNLVPIWSVLEGDLTLGDVFLIYWCENVVFWLVGMVRVSTAQARPGHPNLGFGLFFGLHYGIFTAGHGQVAFGLAEDTGGFHSGPWAWALVGAGIAVGHLVSLWLGWFGNAERDLVDERGAMVVPYVRLVILHGGFIAAGVLLSESGSGETAAAGAVALLCVGKLVLDLGLHLAGPRLATRTKRARPGRHAADTQPPPDVIRSGGNSARNA